MTMNSIDNWWVVTDLDGTLMDHNYEIGPAVETLQWLRECGVPVIPCTSKTAAEVQQFRSQYGIGRNCRSPGIRYSLWFAGRHAFWCCLSDVGACLPLPAYQIALVPYPIKSARGRDKAK